MAKIFLYAKRPNYGATPLIAKAIQCHTDHDVIQCYSARDPLGFHEYSEGALYLGKHCQSPLAVEAVNSSDHLIFVGSSAYNRFWERLAPRTKHKWKSSAVILTDSSYYRLAPVYNKSFKKKGVTVYAMPDLFAHAKKVKAIPFYPPVDVQDIEIAKPKQGVRLCHSTRSVGKKGLSLSAIAFRR